MPLTIDEYRCKLFNKILHSSSPHEVKRFIDAAMKGLELHKVNGHIVARFVNKLILDAARVNPTNNTPQQCSNIDAARLYFDQVKNRLFGTGPKS